MITRLASVRARSGARPKQQPQRVTAGSFLLVILSAFFAVSSVGCAQSGPDPRIARNRPIVDAEVGRFLDWIENNTDFDAYGNSLYLDERIAAQEYRTTIANLDRRSPSNFYFWNYDDRIAFHIRKREPAYFLDTLRMHGIPAQDAVRARAQMIRQGYVVWRTGPAQGNVNFGSYTVPAVAIVGVRSFKPYTSPIRVRKFVIKKNTSPGLPPSEGASPTPSVTPSLAERLREIKQLLDEGLIDDAEYSVMRKKALEGF